MYLPFFFGLVWSKQLFTVLCLAASSTGHKSQQKVFIVFSLSLSLSALQQISLQKVGCTAKSFLRLRRLHLGTK